MKKINSAEKRYTCYRECASYFSFPSLTFFLKNIFSAASGLNCSTQDLHFLMQDLHFLMQDLHFLMQDLSLGHKDCLVVAHGLSSYSTWA